MFGVHCRPPLLTRRPHMPERSGRKFKDDGVIYLKPQIVLTITATVYRRTSMHYTRMDIIGGRPRCLGIALALWSALRSRWMGCGFDAKPGHSWNVDTVYM